MPTPPSSGTSGSVKRYADQKVQKTWKKRRVEKVINLSSIQKKEGDGSSENMEDDEVHSPPALKLFQQVAELARKAVQNVAGENKEQLQKEDEVVEEEIVQDEVVTQMGDDEIPQENYMAAVITEEDRQKIDSAGDASFQKEVENVVEKEHQKVDTPKNVEENPLD